MIPWFYYCCCFAKSVLVSVHSSSLYFFSPVGFSDWISYFGVTYYCIMSHTAYYGNAFLRCYSRTDTFHTYLLRVCVCVCARAQNALVHVTLLDLDHHYSIFKSVSFTDMKNICLPWAVSSMSDTLAMSKHLKFESQFRRPCERDHSICIGW